MIDTHTHLYLPDYSLDGQVSGAYDGQCAAVDRALEAGVRMMVFPNVDRASIEPMLALHGLRPDVTSMAMGLHPTEVKEGWRDELAYCMDILACGPSSFVAIGEVGIDLYWDKTFEDEQMQALAMQFDAARSYGLPVIIHCREGLPQVLEVMSDYTDVPAVFHSFGGTPEDVERIRAVGDYYFGINGIVTFKNSNLGPALAEIGSSRLLSETDSPYLSPVPFRGRTNESMRIPLIVAKMAEFMGMPFENMADITTRNAREFLKI